MFQGSFQWISMIFERNSKKILGKFQMCFKEVSNVIKESFLGASRKFKGCFKKFRGCFKKVSRVSQGRLKGVSMEF